MIVIVRNSPPNQNQLIVRILSKSTQITIIQRNEKQMITNERQNIQKFVYKKGLTNEKLKQEIIKLKHGHGRTVL